MFKVLCRTKTRKQLRVLRHNQRESDKLRSLDVEITTMSRCREMSKSLKPARLWDKLPNIFSIRKLVEAMPIQATSHLNLTCYFEKKKKESCYICGVFSATTPFTWEKNGRATVRKLNMFYENTGQDIFWSSWDFTYNRDISLLEWRPLHKTR